MTSYYSLVASGAIWTNIRKFKDRIDVLYGSREDKGKHGHLVIKKNIIEYNKPMSSGQIANLGKTELGLYSGDVCVSYAFLGKKH